MIAARVIEAGVAGPLGNNTDFATLDPFIPAEPVPIVQDYAAPELCPDGYRWPSAVVGWLSRVHARDILRARGLRHRLTACGLAIAQPHKVVRIYRCPDGARGKVVGVCACGQTICCPTCAPRVGALRAAEVEQGHALASLKGYDLRLETLTAPHQAGSPLMTEALWWRDAWRWAFSDGKQSAAAKLGWVGYITATELTHGSAGWHYHRHLLHVYERGAGELGSELMRRRWLDAVKRFGRGNDHVARYAFDSKPLDSSAAARYVAKIGAELAATTTKESQTPLRILRDAAIIGEDAPLWVEALVVCTALKIGSVRWSRGLRGKLGLSAETPDEVAAQEVAQKGDEFLGVLTRDQWSRVVRARLEFRLLQEAQNGADAVNSILAAASAGSLASLQDLADINL